MTRLFHVLKYDRAKTGTEFNCCSCSLADKTTTKINFILILLFWPKLLDEHSPHSAVFELLSIDWITNLETHSKDFRCCPLRQCVVSFCTLKFVFQG